MSGLVGNVWFGGIEVEEDVLCGIVTVEGRVGCGLDGCSC